MMEIVLIRAVFKEWLEKPLFRARAEARKNQRAIILQLKHGAERLGFSSWVCKRFSEARP